MATKRGWEGLPEYSELFLPSFLFITWSPAHLRISDLNSLVFTSWAPSTFDGSTPFLFRQMSHSPSISLNLPEVIKIQLSPQLPFLQSQIQTLKSPHDLPPRGCDPLINSVCILPPPADPPATSMWYPTPLLEHNILVWQKAYHKTAQGYMRIKQPVSYYFFFLMGQTL